MKVEIHEILKFVRQKSKKSQEELAFLLQVDVKTIRKWETGKSEPPCSKVVEWFRGVGMNPIPYLLVYAYPNDFKLEEMQDADKIANLYALITENLTIEDKKALVQIFSGMHGSSPSSVIQPGFPRIHTSLTLTIRPETLGNIEFNCIFTCHLVHSVV